MRYNEKIAVSTERVLLVPYDAHHVPQYHSWMEDEAIREATASDRLMLQEEYENQVSWRTSADKLTFILCRPLESAAGAKDGGETVVAGRDDVPGRMLGDINMFLTPWDDDDNEEEESGAQTLSSSSSSSGAEFVRAEVDVMIAGAADRGKGLGKAAVGALLAFVARNRAGILGEYAMAEETQRISQGGGGGGGAAAAAGRKLEIREFVVRIKASNAGSIALFTGFGFRQRGEVNYFGEIEMVLSPSALVGEKHGGEGVDGYREAKYDRSGLPTEAN